MNSQLNDEIDFIKLLKKINKSKKNIIWVSFTFIIIGVVFSLLSPIKYNSTTVFIPQNQESTPTSLSGVASLVGINLGSVSTGGDIPATMYPQVSSSPKFKRSLLELIIDKKTNLTLKEFLVKHYKIKDEDKSAPSLLFMTLLEEACFKILDDIISINVNEKDGFITISTSMPIAEYSAIIAKESREILQQIIIENKIETARLNLNSSKKQLDEKKLEFDEIQSKLAYFSDSNLNASNSFVINEKNKLEAEFQIISAVVTELSKQVEQAKLQVSKDTPVFITIKEALVPNLRTSPKRTRLVLIFGLVGFIISCTYILIKDYFKNIYYEINQ